MKSTAFICRIAVRKAGDYEEYWVHLLDFGSQGGGHEEYFIL
jgi:hypothetical protein